MVARSGLLRRCYSRNFAAVERGQAVVAREPEVVCWPLTRPPRAQRQLDPSNHNCTLNRRFGRIRWGRAATDVRSARAGGCHQSSSPPGLALISSSTLPQGFSRPGMGPPQLQCSMPQAAAPAEGGCCCCQQRQITCARAARHAPGNRSPPSPWMPLYPSPQSVFVGSHVFVCPPRGRRACSLYRGWTLPSALADHQS